MKRKSLIWISLPLPIRLKTLHSPNNQCLFFHASALAASYVFKNMSVKERLQVIWLVKVCYIYQKKKKVKVCYRTSKGRRVYLTHKPQLDPLQSSNPMSLISFSWNNDWDEFIFYFYEAEVEWGSNWQISTMSNSVTQPTINNLILYSFNYLLG